MTEQDDILTRLRSASEVDVEAVLALWGSEGDIELVDSADLLKFYNRMIDFLLT